MPKDDWQIVELIPSDFVLADGPTDPKDPDNRLDLDQVSSIGLTDIDQVLAQAGSPATDLLGIKPGPHKLYLADVDITSGGTSASAISPDTLDDFGHPQVKLGGARGSPR